MTVDQMRLFLISCYPKSSSWSDKVKRMPDNQVIAMYHNKYSKILIKDNPFIKNPNKCFMNDMYKPTPEYVVCPQCGASLDIDERCDCGGSLPLHSL